MECHGENWPRSLPMLREQRGGQPDKCPPFAALLTGRFDVLAVAEDVFRVVEVLDPGEPIVGVLSDDRRGGAREPGVAAASDPD